MHGVNTQILQATINYLAKQPFEDVAQLIQALRQSQPIPDTAPVETPVEETKKSK